MQWSALYTKARAGTLARPSIGRCRLRRLAVLSEVLDKVRNLARRKRANLEIEVIAR